jgi:hypothetical protein
MMTVVLQGRGFLKFYYSKFIYSIEIFAPLHPNDGAG